MRQGFSVESAQVIQVIQTVSTIGKGIEGDPIRPVYEYWTLEGKLLALRDPVKDGERVFDGEEA